MIYRTVMGDTLDSICHKHYGQASGYVEQVLDVNYRLSDQPFILPMGLEIELPDKPDEEPIEKQTLINLWD